MYDGRERGDNVLKRERASDGSYVAVAGLGVADSHE